MTELELYKFIQDRRVEVHMFFNGREIDNISEFNDCDHNKWDILAFIDCADIKEFITICGESMFEEGFTCVLKWKYVAVDLLEIMSYHGLKPKNVFK